MFSYFEPLYDIIKKQRARQSRVIHFVLVLVWKAILSHLLSVMLPYLL